MARDNEVMCRFTHLQLPSHVFCVVYRVDQSPAVPDISEELWAKTMDGPGPSGLMDLLLRNTKAAFEMFFTPVQVAVAFGGTLMIGVGAWSLLTLDKNKNIMRSYMSYQERVKETDKKKDFEQRRRQAQVMLEDVSLLASHDRL